jgi:hypothetical protein
VSDALVAGLELDVQVLSRGRLPKNKEGILSRKDVGVAEPANKPPILDPGSIPDDRAVTTQLLEETDENSRDLTCGREFDHTLHQLVPRPADHDTDAERRVELLLRSK